MAELRNTGPVGEVNLRRLGLDAVGLVADIDRSERIDTKYFVEAGQLRSAAVPVLEVPRWYTEGDGDFTVAHQIEFCSEAIAGGGILLGAFDAEAVLGLCVVNPAFEPPMAWLAFLHVTAPARRGGVASALWAEAVALARTAGARSLYVSATPSPSAVGFYLGQGCRLTEPHPELFAREPEDIHLSLALDSN